MVESDDRALVADPALPAERDADLDAHALAHRRSQDLLPVGLVLVVEASQQGSDTTRVGTPSSSSARPLCSCYSFRLRITAGRRSTTTTTSSSTAPPRWPGRRMSSSASRPTAGMPAGRGRQRHRRDRGRHRGRPRRRPTEPDRGPDPHRLRQPEQAGQPEGARLAARPRGGPPRPRRPTAGTRTGRSSSRTMRSRTSARRSRGRGARRRVGDALRRATRDADPDAAAELPPPDRPARLPDGWDADLRRTRPAPRSRRATPARTRSRRWPARCRSCSAAPPTCPSRT